MSTPGTFNITTLSRQAEYMPAITAPICSLLQSAWLFQSLNPSFAISQRTTLWSQTTWHGLLSRKNAVFLVLIHALDTEWTLYRILGEPYHRANI